MIGDAYFQLRAQVGTALFSLLRLATETGAGDGALTALRPAQVELRESFLFLALGPPGGGKSTLLNFLFDREFCGAAEPVGAGKTTVFQYSDEAHEEPLSTNVVALHRPHSFLRDFTVVDGAAFGSPGSTLLEDVSSYLPRADAIFFVVPATGATADIWEFLLRLGRDALRRTVFVVWQSDRVAANEGAAAVKRLRQAMLKNLGHACPIFAASAKDSAGRDKLVRWIENEVIFSARRRTHLNEIDRLAHEALREIGDKPIAEEQALQRTAKQLDRLREDLAEREEQSQRQIAGVLWALAQSFDALRERGESLLRPRLGLGALFRRESESWADFSAEIEAQARESLAVQTKNALASLEVDLRQAAHEYRQATRELLPGDSEPLPFPRAEIAAAIGKIESPIAVESVLNEEIARARLLLRLPVLAVMGASAVTLGAWPVVGLVPGCALLALGGAAFVLLLALLLAQSPLAAFGRHYTANRAALLTVIEAPLREASARFYAALARPLEERIAAHAADRRRHEPLFTRVDQLRQNFAKIAQELRAERATGGTVVETA